MRDSRIGFEMTILRGNVNFNSVLMVFPRKKRPFSRNNGNFPVKNGHFPVKMDIGAGSGPSTEIISLLKHPVLHMLPQLYVDI